MTFPKRISFAHFKKLIRYVQILHGEILHCNSTKQIPFPSLTNRLVFYKCTSGIRQRISELQNLCCESVIDHPQKRANDAMSPTNVIEICNSLVSTEERLIVYLFLTTGLRIGGLCRLILPEDYSKYGHGIDVPLTI